MIPALSLLLATASATAVLAVGGPGAQDATAKARALRQHLADQGVAVIPEATLEARLKARTTPPRVLSAEKLKARVEKAQGLRMEGELAAAADEVETVIRALEEGHLRPEEAGLLEELRVKAAVWRLGAAGPAESGRGESEAGQQALAHLTDAIRANPALALDVARYPPKMRRLLEKARVEVQSAGTAALRVRSSPPGATVIADGRPLGKTPLDLAQGLSAGEHRVWLESGAQRSAVRRVEATSKGAVEFHVDVPLEAGLRGAGPGLILDEGASLDEGRARRLASLVQADEVVSLVRTSDPGALLAIRTDAEGRILSAARAPVDDGAPPDLDALAAAVTTATIEDAALELPWVFPDAGGVAEVAAPESTEPEAEAGSTLLWVAGGVGAGAAAALVVGAGVTAAGVGVYALTQQQQAPADPGLTFSVVVEP